MIYHFHYSEKWRVMVLTYHCIYLCLSALICVPFRSFCSVFESIFFHPIVDRLTPWCIRNLRISQNLFYPNFVRMSTNISMGKNSGSSGFSWRKYLPPEGDCFATTSLRSVLRLTAMTRRFYHCGILSVIARKDVKESEHPGQHPWTIPGNCFGLKNMSLLRS